jgi:Fe-S cluster biosynthesis and repair protein YggX
MAECTRCHQQYDENNTNPSAKKYGACQTCWNEWMTQSIMVINELKLDMSMAEHRKMLGRYERAFFGTEPREEGMKDYSKEENRVPDKH